MWEMGNSDWTPIISEPLKAKHGVRLTVYRSCPGSSVSSRKPGRPPHAKPARLKTENPGGLTNSEAQAETVFKRPPDV